MSTSKYFKIQELVTPEIYKLLEEDAGKLLDTKLIETIDKVRELVGVPLICNDGEGGGTRKQCGLRGKNYALGAKKSHHKYGRAVDLISTKKTAKEIREIIEKHQDELPHSIRVEKGDSKGELTWVHIDTGDTKGQKVYFFKG